MESSSSHSTREAVIRYADFDNPLGDDWSVDRSVIKNGLVLTASDLGKETCEKICKDLRDLGYKIDWVARSNTVVIKTTEEPKSMMAIWKRHVAKFFA